MVSAGLAVRSGTFGVTSQLPGTHLSSFPPTVYYIYSYLIPEPPAIRSPISHHIVPRFQISCRGCAYFRRHRGWGCLGYIISLLPSKNTLIGLTCCQNSSTQSKSWFRYVWATSICSTARRRSALLIKANLRRSAALECERPRAW